MRNRVSKTYRLGIEVPNAKCYEGRAPVKTNFRHKYGLLILAGLVSILSGCQNRNGVMGSNNWNRDGYNNYLLNGNRMFTDGQAVAYLTSNQATPAPVSSNPQAGGVQTGGTTGGSAGGVQGATSGVGANCLLKIASVSPSGSYNSSSQNYAQTYHNSGYPSGGQIAFATGTRLPVPCDRTSEIGATANAFYVTGGANSNILSVYRSDVNGASYGEPQALTIGTSSKIAASPSGHIAVVTNGGKTVTLMFEGRIGGDGGWLADKYHEMPFPYETVQDVVIDDIQGGLYIGTKLPGGAGRVYVYNLHEAFNGRFNPYLDSQFYRNYSFQYADETSAAFLFRYANPVKLKNFNGLTGMFMSGSGKPMFMETVLALNSSEIANANNDELDDIFEQQRTDATVSQIRVFDPFMTMNQGSPYNQVNSNYLQYKDFAVGKDMAYLITESGTLYSVYVNSERPSDVNTPWQNNLNMGQRLNAIEMSYDQTYAIISGSAGLTIGRVSGGNLIFNTIGRPDISDSEVYFAASIAKTSKVWKPGTTTSEEKSSSEEK